ncbi:MAG: hypothetical protein JJU05_07705 [Verrucomicrobia bacterium]|nr:hypothetical protein [Verrucomicrobiota bacterium]MCH8528750.1 hypothetical protein [Kiritimatiellia bacterium]
MRTKRLNPIVVKELRQGLKSKSFLVCFLGLQAFMVLSMSIYFMNTNSSGGLRGAEGFFWTLVGMALLFFMPLRSFFGIYNEIRNNTLELLFLTHMSSNRIAAGKWMAQAMQVLMLTSSILPYFVLRYVLGTINIAQDFRTLGILLTLSLLLLAFGTGLSAWKSKLIRFLIIGGIVFMLFWLPNVLIVFAFGGMSGILPGFAWNPLTFLLLSAVLILIFLEHGASIIAPPAENHTRPKRMLSLLLFSVLYGTGVLRNSEAWLIASIAVLFPYCLGTLSQPVSGIPSLYKRPRCLAALHGFFLPGWPSALLPVLLIIGIPVLTLHANFPRDGRYLHLFPVLFSILFLPVAILELFKVRLHRWLLFYLLIHAGTFVLGVILLIIDQIQKAMHGGDPLHTLLNLFPFTALFQMTDRASLSLIHNWIPAGLSGLCLLLMLPRTLRPMRALTRIARSPAPHHAE